MNNKGQGLTQVLVLTGLISIISMAVLTLLQNQNKETSALMERLSKSESATFLIGAVSNRDICTYMIDNFSSRRFNAASITSADGAEISVTKILAAANSNAPTILQVGQPVSSLTNKVVPADIKVRLTSKNANTFYGHLLVEFDQSKLTRSMKAIQLPIAVETDSTTPNANKLITSCSSTSSGTPSGSQVSAKAYFNWSKAEPSHNKSMNVSVSESDGKLYVTFTEPQADAKYAVLCNGAIQESGSGELQMVALDKTTTSFRIAASHGGGGDPIGIANCVIFND